MVSKKNILTGVKRKAVVGVIGAEQEGALSLKLFMLYHLPFLLKRY